MSSGYLWRVERMTASLQRWSLESRLKSLERNRLFWWYRFGNAVAFRKLLSNFREPRNSCSNIACFMGWKCKHVEVISRALAWFWKISPCYLHDEDRWRGRQGMPLSRRYKHDPLGCISSCIIHLRWFDIPRLTPWPCQQKIRYRHWPIHVSLLRQVLGNVSIHGCFLRRFAYSI